MFSDKAIKDPTIYYQVDIGLPKERTVKKNDIRLERLNHIKQLKSDANFEKMSRHGTCKFFTIDLKSKQLIFIKYFSGSAL
jgi:hypothetical protein